MLIGMLDAGKEILNGSIDGVGPHRMVANRLELIFNAALLDFLELSQLLGQIGHQSIQPIVQRINIL